MMKSSVTASLIAVALAGLGCVVREAAPARPAEEHAMRNGFVYLGERTVNGGLDHDAIHVGRQDGQFHEIMIVVERAPSRSSTPDSSRAAGMPCPPDYR
jgi:hypothetical protein